MRSLYGWAPKKKADTYKEASYFEGGLVIRYRKFSKKIFLIEVSSREAVVEIRRRLDERKLFYFGKRKQIILDSLGQPDSRTKHSYTYTFSNSKGESGQVTFYFAGLRSNHCTRMKVVWKV